MKQKSRGLNKIFPDLAITFDVEEWTLPQEFGIKSSFCNNTDFSRAGCAQLINLLKKYDIKATFFVTGYFAINEPLIVKSLSEAGHEIASHAYNNVQLNKFNPEEKKNLLIKTDKILSGLIVEKILGFRAPRCYVDTVTIDILIDLKYRYDSSVHPAIVPGYYYNWRYPLVPYIINRTYPVDKINQEILELPISVIPLIRLPISWWWMRNIGDWLTYLGTNINLRSNRCVILYFHAWEYASLPNIKGLPAHLTKGCGEAFLARLDKFIGFYRDKFQFKSLKDIAKSLTLFEAPA